MHMSRRTGLAALAAAALLAPAGFAVANAGATTGAALKATITTTHQVIPANGKSTTTITVKYTKGGRPTKGVVVKFGYGGSKTQQELQIQEHLCGKLSKLKGTTNAKGTFSTTYTSAKVVGFCFIEATVGDPIQVGVPIDDANPNIPKGYYQITAGPSSTTVNATPSDTESLALTVKNGATLINADPSVVISEVPEHPRLVRRHHAVCADAHRARGPRGTGDPRLHAVDDGRHLHHQGPRRRCPAHQQQRGDPPGQAVGRRQGAGPVVRILKP